MGQFQNAYPELMHLSPGSYHIAEAVEAPDGTCSVAVDVSAGCGGQGTGSARFRFVMARKALGKQRGAWMTLQLLRGAGAECERAEAIGSRHQGGWDLAGS
ncbi:hypothetical protein WJX81_006331 [Elliptochloris bilobata]|uniref:Uncharacterized protein n=1 Tax=Elliptochloris bilobata TaxID=381761 RepID=A0AAW1RQT9_9CHLO